MRMRDFRLTFAYIVGVLLGFLAANTFGADLFDQVPVLRKVNYSQPILVDIESRTRNDRYARAARNKRDIGNWVHEQTHVLNAQLGIAKKAETRVHGWTSAYVLGGQTFLALQPEIKLADIGPLVPEDERGWVYKEYLAWKPAIKSWNDWPLYVLDETSAAANALAYERIKKGPAYARRKELALDWAKMSPYLIEAVEKGDPDYADLPRLREFVTWQRLRILKLADVLPPLPQKPEYKLW